MRLPLSIVIPLCILFTIGLWMLRTKRFGGMKAPGAKELTHITDQYRSESGPIRQVIPKHKPTPTTDPTTSAEEHEKQVEPKLKIDLVEASIAPGLAEYAGEALKGSKHLLDLGEALTSENFGERALLAYERVLDSSAASLEYQQAAIEKIQHLRAYLPQWVCDPNERSSLQLNISIPKSHADIAKQINDDITKLFSVSASGLITITANVEEAAQKNNNTPKMVTIFLSDPEDAKRISQVFASPLKEDFTATELYRNTYKMIRNHLLQTTDFQPLPELNEQADAQLLLSHAITRLVWRELPKTLRNRDSDA